MKGHGFLARLGYAATGLRHAWRMEKSLRAHALAAAGVAAVLLWCGSPPVWWALMALSIGLVVTCELLNTAIETLADRLHPQRDEAIRITKDVAAGAVLAASVMALFVAAAFVVDQLWPLLSMWLTA